MVTLTLAEKDKATNFSDMEEDDLDEEPGEVIESAPPWKVGEERELGNSGIKKRLIKRGHGWETPSVGDEATVHYVGTLLDGTKFDSTRDRDEPLMLKLGHGQLSGLETGIITMKQGEIALYTLPAELCCQIASPTSITAPPKSITRFEVELISWITVVDVFKDGGVIKKMMWKGEGNERPRDLDEVLVNYKVALPDGSIVVESKEEGAMFYIKDGHLFPWLAKVIMSMRRGEKAKLIVQSHYGFGGGTNVCNGVCSIAPDSVLHVDLELISFKPVVDVSGDSKVLKKILREGEGAVANEGASVSVSYTAKLDDGTVFEKKGIDGEPPLEFVTDEEQVITGLDRAIATMRNGEKATLTIHPDFGYGNVEVQRDLAVVPPGSNVIYDVEMLRLIKEKAPWELNQHEKIETAEKKKEEGNLLFKAGKYQQARKKYEKAADYVCEDESFNAEEQKLIKTLRVSCWLNGAACNLKLNNFQEAIMLCSKVLDVEFQNIKALFRRAQAYLQSGEFLLSDADIKKALEADPDNREVKLLQRKLKQLQAESNKRDAGFYANMFACKEKDSSMATKKQKLEKPDDVRKGEDVMTMEMEKVEDSSTNPKNGFEVDSQ